MREVKKIVIIGPESTGKSTLCRLLAEHFKTVWCPEYAREYLLLHGMNYTYEDLLEIAKGQIALEKEYLAKAKENRQSGVREYRNPLLFEDTDMYVMKVWCEYVFGKCHQYILDQISKATCDLYLLCNVDVPWVEEELREYPDLETRKKLYDIYRAILINQQVPWIDISGNYENRLATAVTATIDLLSGEN